MHLHALPDNPCDLSPSAEIVPGVPFGRPEWVPSPAFWLSLASQGWTDDERYVSAPGSPLADDVAFCILGGYGIRMEVNQAAWDRLQSAGALRPPVDAATIEALLMEPLTVFGRLIRYRFPRQRAGRLAETLNWLEGLCADEMSPLALRDELMTQPGIGPKTASWIVRNWTGTDDVAILDVHVIRAGQIMGLFPKTIRLPRDYAVLEARFLEFADALSIPASYLDALIWREMRAFTT